MPKLKKVLSSRGSLLLEALLSVIILSVSITVILRGMTSSLRAAQFVSTYTQAMMLMDNTMMSVFKKGSTEALAVKEGDYEQPFDEFHYSIETGNYDDQALQDAQSVPDLDELALTVSWGDRNLKKKVSLSTLLFKTIESSDDE